jgi:hypothetical protein
MAANDHRDCKNWEGIIGTMHALFCSTTNRTNYANVKAQILFFVLFVLLVVKPRPSLLLQVGKFLALRLCSLRSFAADDQKVRCRQLLTTAEAHGSMIKGIR